MLAARRLPTAAFALALAAAGFAFAQQPPGEVPEDEIPTAPVVVDGEAVLRLRGVGSYTAEHRAAAVTQRLIDLATDPSFDPKDLRIVDDGRESRIVGGSKTVLRLVDADGAVESLDRKTFADAALALLRRAIVKYRAERSREAIVGAAGRATLAFLIALFAALAVLRVSGTMRGGLEKRFGDRLALKIQSFELLRGEHMWAWIANAMALARAIALAVVGFLALRYALAQFPATRTAAGRLGDWVLQPLQTLGLGFVAQLPNLVFLVVLYFVTRWALRVLRLFFASIGSGDVTFSGFDREWAEPSYKLARIAVVACAAVVAYPYIPGSSSNAFKGVSIFFGVLLSLGSSSLVGNIVAGYTMTYRRAFHEGDVIRIGEIVGRVTGMRLIVTHLRTPKNEEVVIPNSTLLTTEIVNYSTLARQHGLILHTTVRIGYETPWRQVEAMLIEAAQRTPGLLSEPPPFVLQKSLGEFAVTYEINVACADATRMAFFYAELHRRILDVFNEYGVQIMTPAYEGDPETPKVVPTEQWHRTPAVPPALEAERIEPDGRGPAAPTATRP